jgi:nicotinamidase-related amidase
LQLPTRDNSAIVFLDLQDGIAKNSRTLSIEELRRTTGALAKLAALHQLPVSLSAVPPGGPFLAPVLVPLHNIALRLRTATSAFADRGLVDALRSSGRRMLVLAGVASEIVVQRAALDALAAAMVFMSR